MRGHLGRATFALAALGLAAASGPASAACKVAQIAQLPVTMQGDSPMVSVKIDGVDARLVADSGAFWSMLTPALAARARLHVGPLPYGFYVRGVNGAADVGLTTVKDFGVVGATLHDRDFLVGGSRMEGRGDGLLGQNLLTVLDTEFDLANGAIRLFKTSGCGSDKALAYWANNQPYSVLDLDLGGSRRTAVLARASVNGHPIMVQFDSGAYRSLLSLKAARAAGVQTDSPGVVPAGAAGGIGRTLSDSWIAPFASFKLGDEEIKNTRLRIGRLDSPDVDMLLGADFFLSHRIFISRAQGKIYFTYNGGPVFRLDRLPAPPPGQALASASGSAPAAHAGLDEPKDAEGFARRAGARAARGDVPAAIDDLGRAIMLDPKDPKLLFQRSQLYLRQRRPALALADLQAALRIDPRFAPALMSLGARSLGMRDEAGARANFEAAVAADPALAMTVAAIYANQGWFDRSLALWDQWIAAHGRDDRLPDALNGRCWTRALWGRDLDKALKDCNRAVGMSHISSFLDSRGLVRLRLGDYRQAISDYTAALKDNPRMAWSLYGRGLAEARLGDKDKADADLKAAVALNPGLPVLAKRYGIGS